MLSILSAFISSSAEKALNSMEITELAPSTEKDVPRTSTSVAIATLALIIVGGLLNSQPMTSPLQPLPINSGDTAWILAATALVLLMTPGLAFFYGGMINHKQVVTTMFLSFIAMGVVTLIWVTVGFSLAFGQSIGGLIGDPRTFFMFKSVHLSPDTNLSPTIPLVLFAVFQLKFAIITPALVTGTFAERIKVGAYILMTILFSLLIYAPLAHWTWHPDGILRKWGVLDFAGGTVVHMSAGFAGLAGALAISRKGNPKNRKNGVNGGNDVNEEAEHIVPSNIPFVLLGTGLLWFGWFGFNAGSALAANDQAVLAFMTTNTAAATAMVAWVLFDIIMGRQVSAVGAAIGAVVGLVAITPASGFVSVGASVFIGAVAACASNFIISKGIRNVLDDTLDVFACHGVGGLVGMILTGVFAKDGGLITGSTTLFTKHVIASLGVSTFAFVMSIIIFKLVGKVTSLYHDGSAIDS